MSLAQMGHFATLDGKVKWALVFILLVFVLAGCGTAELKQKKIMPTAVDGIVDLTGWDFSKEGPVRLAGKWEFYWQQLLGPGDFESANVHKKL